MRETTLPVTAPREEATWLKSHPGKEQDSTTA